MDTIPAAVGRRSALLAAWGSAWLAGAVSHDDAVATVTGTDEVHDVAWPAAGEPSEGIPLGWALGRLRSTGAHRLRLVLPVPGDPTGLPGPTPLGRAALAAGEAVLTAGAAEGSGVGLVPEVHEHGTPTDG
ncbi:MAG: hypothetical protein ACYDB7_04610, partial [Mycobacteriales bacterium]